MNDQENILYGTTDAHVWAREFMASFSPEEIDEELLVTWFANAIETALRLNYPDQLAPISQSDARRYHEHSVLLNRIAWKIAETLGRVKPCDITRELERPDQVIDELNELIQLVVISTTQEGPKP